MERAEEQLQHALALASVHLDRRDRTVSEMRAHLQGKGIDPAVAEEAVAELRAVGYLDDSRYARLFVEDKRELEQWGTERIRRTLVERGVARDLVDEVLSISEPEDELERALSLLRRRFAQPPRERRERDRALGMLLRKGYDGELALDALSAYARAGAE